MVINHKPVAEPAITATHAHKLGTTAQTSNLEDSMGDFRMANPQWMAPKKLKMVAPYANNAKTRPLCMLSWARQDKMLKKINGISPK